MWFCHVLNFWDTRTVGVSPGRVDQYFYPYYQKDRETGRMTREEAVELLECFRVKLGALRNFDVAHVREATSGETQFHNCTLGGQTSDGKDATNELSFLWLEAAERTRTPHPTLSIRWHENLSPEFALKAAQVCSLGMGYPAWFGDRASISYLMAKGATLEEARDYAIAGCVLHVIPHKTAATWPTVVSMAKIFEITLYNGFDPGVGKQVGPETGHFEDSNTFEDLYNAFKAQVKYFLARSTSYLNRVRLFRADKLPDLFVSSFFDDCIKKGESVIAGGARYQYGSMYLIPVGVVDVGDSLAAIKKCVFEDHSIAKKELIDALRANFEGKDNIRRQLLAVSKFGNDNDYVDSIVADLYAWLTITMNNIEGPYGSRYENAPHSLSFHGAAGRKVGALPSGRFANISLADGAVSPCQGADQAGPTAVIKSAGKIDHAPIFGTLFNMKFHPSALKSKDDIMKFLALVKVYFEVYGGKHLQFNVVDRKTLIEAQENPQSNRNLVVRVAGYSAHWVELDRKIQNEIIARTEHSL
jgi:pyruvate-formate lyase